MVTQCINCCCAILSMLMKLSEIYILNESSLMPEMRINYNSTNRSFGLVELFDWYPRKPTEIFDYFYPIIDFWWDFFQTTAMIGHFMFRKFLSKSFGMEKIETLLSKQSMQTKASPNKFPLNRLKMGKQLLQFTAKLQLCTFRRWREHFFSTLFNVTDFCVGNTNHST